MNIIKKTINGLVSLIEGLKVTISNGFQKPFTLMYPKKKEELPKISRQCLQMNYKEGESKCVACKICEKSCPQHAIKIETEKINGKEVLKKYTFYPEKCMYCGICTEKCPFDAISWNQNFDMASKTKDQTINYKRNS